MLKTFRKGGIHPAPHKTAGTEIVLLPLPRKAIMPLSQHMGQAAKAIVAKGDKVVRGQLIADSEVYISAGLHAPVSGTVTAIEPVLMPTGLKADAIIIEATEEEHKADSDAREKYWAEVMNCKPGENELPDKESIRKSIRQAGIVGLGGAAFPSHVKLGVAPEKAPELLIINGCECEPYLMCDDALMCRYPQHIVQGVRLMMAATGAPRAIIALEDNKPEAAAALKEAAVEVDGIEIAVLKTKYPQGGEKQLVEALTGHRIASGAIPLSVGAIVNNVATAFAVWQAVHRHMPLIERVVTLSGDIARSEQTNYMTALGTPLAAFPATLPQDVKYILGGPMMGRTAVCLDGPIVKGTSGITVLAGTRRRAVQPCVRCGACVDACPMGLEPYLLSAYGRMRMWDEARAASATDCLECGACSYSCPSARPLLDYIRIAKQRSR